METVISSGSLTVTILHQGAEVSSVKNNDNLEFMWQADSSVWPRHAPVLFPIVGRLRDNILTSGNRKYELGQHGFARDMEFELLHHSSNTCTFGLNSNDASREKYPFDFTFRITYRVDKDTLITSYNIVNPTSGNILATVGAHPGFRCPLIAGEKFSDYYLQFEKNVLEQTPLSNGLRSNGKIMLGLNGNKLQLTPATFDKDALVFENNQVNRITLRSNVSTHSITMECEGWPYFGVWSKKGCTEFVCLEPWYGIADHENHDHDLTSKEGMITITPGNSFNCSYSVTFS